LARTRIYFYFVVIIKNQKLAKPRLTVKAAST
jgi:hypothetical protein